MWNKFIDFLNIEKAKMAKLDRKQRAEYIWDYYKIPIIATIAIIAMIAYTLSYSLGRGTVSCYITMVNAQEGGDSSFFVNALNENGYDGSTVSVDTTLQYRNTQEMAQEDVVVIQVLAAQFAVGDMDVFTAPREVFERYTEQNAFENLALLLPQELQKEHEDELVRYTTDNGQETVGGIILKEGSPLHKAGYYSGDVVIGIATRAEHLDEALAVIRMILESN